MGLRARFRQRWKAPHFRQAFGITVVAILLGATLASMIQMRFGLYRSSITMTLVGCATAVIGVTILWLLDSKRYGWAWAVTLIAPPAAYFAFLAVLTAHPPAPPLG